MPEIMRPGSDWPVMRALYPVQLWVSAGSGLTGGQGFKSAQTGNVLISAAGRPRRRRRRVSQARAAVVPSTGTGWALAHNAACRVLRKAAGGSPVPPRIGKQRIRQVISRGGGRHPWIPARARRAGDDGNAERDVDAQACRLGVAGCQPAASPGGLPRSLVIFPDATLTIAASAMILRRPER
jgi:hypothetical protein